MRHGHDAPEAPTHLRSSDLPPEWLHGTADESDPTTAHRGPAGGAKRAVTEPMGDEPVSIIQRVADSAHRRPSRGRSTSEPMPLPSPPTIVAQPRSRSPKATPAPAPAAAPAIAVPEARVVASSTKPAASGEIVRAKSEPPRAKTEPASQPSRSQTPSKSAPSPSRPQPPQGPAVAAVPGMPGMGAFDPLQIPTPPELAGPIYAHVRRLALQADLAGADRVLRDALADLTSSLSVAIIYPGADGLWSLGNDDEVPRDTQPLVAVAQARRALIASHTALIPIVTSTETVGVIMLTRNPRQQGYLPVEQIAMVAMVRESAPILHHLAVQHLQKQTEIAADKGSLYRGEALEAHRTRGQEGVLVQLSPNWVRRTYPFLVGALVVGIVAASLIKVNTYSTGSAVVWFDGVQVSAPAIGTVSEVLVTPGTAVKKNDVLVRLSSTEQDNALTAAQTDRDLAIASYLIDMSDEQARKSLGATFSPYEHAKAAVANRVVRAPRDGVVSDIRVRVSQPLNMGEHILTLVDKDVQPEVRAFLPGNDRPRLRPGMELQVELQGYTKSRETAIITSVGNEIIGGNEASKYIGPELADALKLQGSFVVVTARLPKRTFQTEHRTHYFHHGMEAKTEVKIQSKPFLVTLMPALEKYIPD